MSQEFIRKHIHEYRVKEAGDRVTYVLPLEELLGLRPKPWSRQRPVDEGRVTAIVTTIQERSDVDGMLLMAWHPAEDLVVYDGQHRWTALTKLDPALPLEVVVEILWNTTEEHIHREFVRVNQSIPVSELYLAPKPEVDIRSDIEAYVRILVKKYPEFVSTKKPNRPNFNRDILTDELYRLQRDEFTDVGFKDLVMAIHRMNDEYDANPSSTARKALFKHPKIAEKCAKHKFWLFAETGHLNVADIRSHL